MNYYKECFLLTLEISLAMFIIIFGYAVWNNFNINDYYIAQLNNNTRDVQVYEENSNLILHNVSKKTNSTKLILKVEKNEFDKIDKAFLTIESEKYNLKDMQYSENAHYYYYLIKNIDFKRFETITYNYYIELNENDLLDYEFLIDAI